MWYESVAECILAIVEHCPIHHAIPHRRTHDTHYAVRANNVTDRTALGAPRPCIWWSTLHRSTVANNCASLDVQLSAMMYI